MTETKEVGLGLGCYSPEELVAPTQHRNQVLSKFPGKDSPLICKFIPDLLGPTLGGKIMLYWEVIEHQHIVGYDKADKPIMYSHPCQKTLGAKKCAECDRYYDDIPKVKLAGEGSTEGKRLKLITDLCCPKTKGWVYFVTPESDIVKAVKLPKDLINQLWGKAKTKYKEAIPSFLDEIRKEGLNPYNLRSPIGWLKLWREGEGFGTEYHVEVAKSEKHIIENGVPKGKMVSYTEASVSEYILKNYPRSELPDFRKLEFRNAFTADESEEFAKNPLITPERILKDNNKDVVGADADEANEAQAASPDAIMAGIGVATSLNEVDAML